MNPISEKIEKFLTESKDDVEGSRVGDAHLSFNDLHKALKKVHHALGKHPVPHTIRDLHNIKAQITALQRQLGGKHMPLMKELGI